MKGSFFYIIRLFSLLVILCFSSYMYSQVDSWNVTRYSSLNGLSTNDVTDMKQDEKGFIWLATSNGICRYDGYSFLSFHPKDSYGLHDNHIASLELDKKKRLLWTISFTGNINCFDLSLGRFVNYLQDSEMKKTYHFHQLFSNGIIFYDNDSGVRIITFDGKTFQKRDFSFEKGTLPDKHIKSVVEDSAGYFWVVTDKGICRISVKGDVRSVGPKEKVLATQVYKDKFCIFYQDNTVDVFHGLKHDKHISCPRIYGIQSKVTVSFLANDNWYIYGNQASLKLNLQTLKFSRAENQISANRKNYQDNRYVVVSDNKGWVFVFEDGKLKTKRNLFEGVSPGITFNYRMKASKNIDGNLYMATAGNGLFVFNPRTNEISPVSITSGETVMPSKILGVLFCDKNGNIWTSLEYAGLYKIYHPSISTKIILPLPYMEGDRVNNIKLLQRVDKGKILVSTKDRKLFSYNEGDNSIQYVKEFPANVYAYHVDRLGRTWIATRSGGFWIDQRQYNKRNFELLTVGNIYDFAEDKYGRVWIATFGDGLLVATTLPNGKIVFSKYLPKVQGENDIRDLMIDTNGWLWLATNRGVFVVDTNKKRIIKSDFINYSKQNGNFRDDEVIGLFKDSKSRIWIGSYGMGVAFTNLPHDYKRIKFEWVTKQNGLLNNNVRSIVEDWDGNIWIASDEGINCFNKVNGYMDSYIDPNHFLSNIYSENSALVLSNGDLLFGTTQGLVRIRFQSYEDVDSSIPQIVDMDVNGESVYHFSSDLAKSLLSGDKIQLLSSENSLTIYFSNLDFSPKTLYRFYLEGMDKGWKTQSSSNMVTYKNVPPGTYRFHVASLCANNKWSQEQVLAIEVAQPWWGLWSVRALFTCFFLTIFAILGRILYNNFKLREKIKFERKFMEFRLNFFSQIVHEFRTPIAIIKSAMDCLKDANTLYDAKAFIKAANRGSDRLLKMVNNLLLFRKVNSGNIKLHVEQCDIINDLRQLYLDFRPMAEAKNIKMVFTVFEKCYSMLYDREKVETIVYNLLSNAIKYSCSKGIVELLVKLDSKQECLLVIVKDSGSGLTEEQEKTLFQPFMHGNVSQGGMGVGLCMSLQLAQLHHAKLEYVKPDNKLGGAKFMLTLSTSCDAYAQNEYKQDITDQKRVKEADAILLQGMAKEALNKKLVFVVEDDSDLLAQTTQLLSVYFQVTGFSNGKRAFEQICKQKPALVISDVMLPEMDGFSISRSVKVNPELSGVKVILLTALDGEKNRLKGILASADDYFVKPYSVQLLVARCFKLIEQGAKQKCSSTPSLDKDEVEEQILITSPADKVFMDKVTSSVYEHLSEEDFSVDQLCDLLNTGRTTTYNRIRELFGMTPNEYIREIRLQKAAKLLLEGEKNVAEVSMIVGFRDPAYFNRRFKARFGMAPSKYGR